MKKLIILLVTCLPLNVLGNDLFDTRLPSEESYEAIQSISDPSSSYEIVSSSTDNMQTTNHGGWQGGGGWDWGEWGDGCWCWGGNCHKKHCKCGCKGHEDDDDDDTVTAPIGDAVAPVFLACAIFAFVKIRRSSRRKTVDLP